MKKYVLIIALILILIAFLSGCGKDNSKEELKTKVITELEYLDTNFVEILNDLNNISLQNYTITSEEINLQSDNSKSEENTNSGANESKKEQKETESQNENNEENKASNITATKTEAIIMLNLDENNINWDKIKETIEIINDAWTIVILDLTELNVENQDILNFSNILNQAIINIENEEKENTLTAISNLYSYIVKFEVSISAPNSLQNIKQSKSYLIKAYTLVNQELWDEVENNISECEKTFKNLMNDSSYLLEKEYKVNKTYTLINELKLSLLNKDKKLFYIKYKNLLQSLNTL